jgi:hypothetical protein
MVGGATIEELDREVPGLADLKREGATSKGGVPSLESNVHRVFGIDVLNEEKEAVPGLADEQGTGSAA